ncbi:MAG: hypothetical protein EOO10_13075 [Chitinophagaceae bacterium]|nr:MAG: hypothetical protein EOO10_13075 [Chitinophagaceae bacterium]
MNPVKTTNLLKPLFLVAAFLTISFFADAQMVTGIWHGKINGQKTEVKIIKSGDSITGTSYYYASANNYRRYTIKGYFDERSNEVIWWDDRLVEEKAGGVFSSPGKVPLLSRADFNCPGAGVMLLDGSSNEKNEEIKEGTVHLEKTYKGPLFTDEWDWVIDNFTSGTNDPYIIDSVSLIAFHPDRRPSPKAEPPVAMNKRPGMVMVPPTTERKEEAKPEPPKVVVAPPSIEQKFIARKKKLFTTIPVTGDSISLSFYDNAIVDGDSISLFLDGRMIFSHIKLSDKPYTVKLAVNDLSDESELVMVAENLGDIPPNTSYMVAMVGDKRHAANLASTEESSAVIRLKKR